jgi:hypothetical protein
MPLFAVDEQVSAPRRVCSLWVYCKHYCVVQRVILPGKAIVLTETYLELWIMIYQHTYQAKHKKLLKGPVGEKGGEIITKLEKNEYIRKREKNMYCTVEFWQH